MNLLAEALTVEADENWFAVGGEPGFSEDRFSGCLVHGLGVDSADLAVSVVLLEEFGGGGLVLVGSGFDVAGFLEGVCPEL